MSHHILVPAPALEAIRQESRHRYPEEACGVLLGRAEGRSDARAVAETRPVGNDRGAERERRYLIGPRTVLAAEEEADARDLNVVGFFHSHPDRAAEPSDFDREHAWPWYSYLIVPVADGEPGPARSWRLRDDRSGFREEVLEILDTPQTDTEEARRWSGTPDPDPQAGSDPTPTWRTQ